MLRWQQAEGKRHALDADPADMPRVAEPFRALCGIEVTPARSDIPGIGSWLDPTCVGCDGVWRAKENIPQYVEWSR